MCVVFEKLLSKTATSVLVGQICILCLHAYLLNSVCLGFGMECRICSTFCKDSFVLDNVYIIQLSVYA